jgi:hypothetical protein
LTSPVGASICERVSLGEGSFLEVAARGDGVYWEAAVRQPVGPLEAQYASFAKVPSADELRTC